MIQPAVFGDGVRCIGGSLKRLGSRNAIDGITYYPQGADLPISDRSAQLGDPIAPGSSRGYQTYYRDADPQFCSAPSGNTFNASNAVQIQWN